MLRLKRAIAIILFTLLCLQQPQQRAVWAVQERGTALPNPVEVGRWAVPRPRQQPVHGPPTNSFLPGRERTASVELLFLSGIAQVRGTVHSQIRHKLCSATRSRGNDFKTHLLNKGLDWMWMKLFRSALHTRVYGEMTDDT